MLNEKIVGNLRFFKRNLLTIFKTLKIFKRLRAFYCFELYQVFVANFDYEPVFL